MTGESLVGVPMKELKNLEAKLERSISRIRSKKVLTMVSHCFDIINIQCDLTYSMVSHCFAE